MKVVILAGGRGTRICEETDQKPKPMVTIGGKPILWHIMKIYSAHGLNDFIICCGYKGDMIKQYFMNYWLSNSDVTIKLKSNEVEMHQSFSEPWNITLVDTGLETMTGGRLKRIQPYVKKERFCFTYGDGLSNVNISRLIEFHKQCKKIATVTATNHSSRFGMIKVDGDLISEFIEKPRVDGSLLNSGFFVFEPEIFNYIYGDHIVLEQEPIHQLVKEQQMAAYLHAGFFHGLDSLRDRKILEEYWNSNKAPWKVWDDSKTMRQDEMHTSLEQVIGQAA